MKKNKLSGLFMPAGKDKIHNEAHMLLAKSARRMLSFICYSFSAFELLISLSLFLFPQRFPVYLWLYLSPAPATIVILLLIKSRLDLTPARFYIIQAAYTLTLCLWCAAVTLADQHNGSDLNVFSYITLAVAASIILPPPHCLVVYTTQLFIFSLLLPYAPGVTDLPGSLLHGFFVFSLAVVISISRYKSKLHSIMDKLVIEKQYRVIKQQNQRLTKLALTDSLTGMGNRRFLEKMIRESDCFKSKPLSVLMVDIDFFKHYNDTYGHIQGDVGLQCLSRIINAFLQEHRGFSVRYGGEEFLICLFDYSRQQAQDAAESLRCRVETSKELCSGKMTVSIGVCSGGPLENQDISQLINKADMALYTAKKKGRNRVECYDEGCKAPPYGLPRI